MTKEQAFGMYLSEDAKILFENKVYDFVAISAWTKTCQLFKGAIGIGWRSIDDCKLILRPFEDMTEEEILTLAKLRIAETSYTISSAEITNCLLRVGYSGWTNGIWYDLRNELDMKQIEYLLEIGIDVFNLRERGWAVYESDITPTVKELGL